MQMIDVLKRLAELDAKNPNVVSEVSKELATKAYNKMADGGNDMKNRTGLAGDQSDRMKARMDKRWGKDEVDAAVQKSREQGQNEEQLGELSPDTLRSYAGKARGQANWAQGVAARSDGGEWNPARGRVTAEPGSDADKYLKHANKRYAGADRADAKAGAKRPTQSQNYDFVKKGGWGTGDTPVKGATMQESLEECGMMGSMGQSHSPASINMTAATGEELSSMLKDIMTLAGRPTQEPMGGEEPMGGADGVAVVDVEPSPEVSADEPSIMRSMMDKLNPETDDSEGQDDDEEKVDEYDNTPNPETSGYDAAVPSGNDLHKEKTQYPAAQRGDNPMAATFESLMAEYKKFINEN